MTAEMIAILLGIAGIVSAHPMSPSASEESAAIPQALESWDVVASRLSGKIPAVFLDYDGTLSALVNDPAKAFMTDHMKKALYKLAGTHHVAIVTGRPQDKIKEFVDLTTFYYATNHGLAMYGPAHKEIDICERVSKPYMNDIFKTLEKKLPGYRLEDNSLSITVHYREVADSDVPRIEKVVNEIVGGSEGSLKKQDGDKIFEILPNVQVNKGDAVNKLCSLMMKDKENVVKIFIGDSASDEDAFKVVADNGIAIRVCALPCKTLANFTVRSPEEVLQVLNHLSEIPSTMVSASQN